MSTVQRQWTGGEEEKKKDKGPGEKQLSVVVVAGRPGGRPLMERMVVKLVVGC